LQLQNMATPQKGRRGHATRDGPHDASYLFVCFDTMMNTGRAPTAEEAALQRRV
jgi:hypothetical protein